VLTNAARMPTAQLRGMLGLLLARGHDDQVVARESLEVHFRHYAAHDAGAALARQVRALDVRDTLAVADRLGELRVPARVVWGMADRFQKAHNGERLARDLGTRPWALPGGKHFTPEDHPAVLAGAIGEVVSAVR
jgi:pimeloyl-ACP methyl ester carboxylesterase